ncbi:MAG: hypothetical protein IIA72_23720 [Proteobacteria bacterium]|nr:hypothetical protein [Pseudomonadota bacterium]
MAPHFFEDIGGPRFVMAAYQPISAPAPDHGVVGGGVLVDRDRDFMADDLAIETVSARAAVVVNNILPANDLVAVDNLELEGLIPARARFPISCSVYPTVGRVTGAIRCAVTMTNRTQHTARNILD